MSQPSFSTLVKAELAVLREKYLFAVDESISDPVFEGMLRSFSSFQKALEVLGSRIQALTGAVESVGVEVVLVSDAFLSEYRQVLEGENLIVSDCYKLREASNQLGRADAPHSSLSKFKRDLEYNVVQPLRAHLSNCRQIRNIVDLRNRKMHELAAASKTDLLGGVTRLQSEFDKVDKHLFEWLFILEEYRGDILDSLLQTMKYLEYEFFASSAHAVAAVLPARMEFRPMVEMTPKQLEAQLRLEGEEGGTDGGGTDGGGTEEASSFVGSGKRGISDYSKRMISKIEKSEPADPRHVVDVLSLSSLLAQGFEEGPARQALRRTGNDTQAALDLLLSHSVEEDVRVPTTLKRLQRLKEIKRRIAERNKERTDARVEAAPREAAPREEAPREEAPLLTFEPTDFTEPFFQRAALPEVTDLLFG